jgi:hypothetical protein
VSARLTPEVRRLRAITEAEWQATVEGIARANRWLAFHPADNRPVTSKSGTRYVQNIKAGYPDLTACRGDRLVFAELKRETGVLSDQQAVWLSALEAAGAECYVWRPSDLAEVREVLA